MARRVSRMSSTQPWNSTSDPTIPRVVGIHDTAGRKTTTARLMLVATNTPSAT